MVFAAFGARFGVLEVPDSRLRHVGEFFSDSSAPPVGALPSGGTLYPVYLTVRHHLASGGLVDVSTRRRSALDVDLAEHMWWSLINLRIAAEDRLTGTDRIEWARDVALQPRPAMRGDCRMLVDGAEARWELMVDGDLAVCGSDRAGQSLLAAVCPVDIVGRLAITTLPAATAPTAVA